MSRNGRSKGKASKHRIVLRATYKQQIAAGNLTLDQIFSDVRRRNDHHAADIPVGQFLRAFPRLTAPRQREIVQLLDISDWRHVGHLGVRVTALLEAYLRNRYPNLGVKAEAASPQED